ncbi:ankyrin repeat-containing domain protein, partial [Coprinopsis sp. MPI-PUGE-AT-0042]
MSNAENIQITGGNFVDIGRDMVTNYNFNGSSASPVPVITTILEMLPAANFRQKHLDTLAKWTEGTSLWIMKHRLFEEWYGSDGPGLLWGTGIQGAGKTIMASLVIKSLDKPSEALKGRISVAYVYIRYSEPLSLSDILGALIRQMLERYEDLLPVVELVYAKHHRERTQPTAEELVGIMVECHKTFNVSFFIIDGLDEAPSDIQYALLKALTSLRAKVFVTSRPLDLLQAKFPDAKFLEIVANKADIEKHINAKISQDPKLRAVLEHGSLKSTAIATIQNKSEGMFLHASLQVEALQNCATSKDAHEVLEQFPTKIEDIYSATMRRIMEQPKHHADVALTVLLWVTYAERPLTVTELQHVAGVCPKTLRFDPTRVVAEGILVSTCCSLVVVDEKTRLVRLIHYTAHEFLKKIILQYFPDPDGFITSVCIAHLAACGFTKSTIESKEALDNALAQDPLLAYAHSSWVHHAQRCHNDKPAPPVGDFILSCKSYPVEILNGCDLLGPDHLIAFYDIPLDLLSSSPTTHRNAATPVYGLTPLAVAASANRLSMLDDLLALPEAEVNHGDWTPLIVACFKGYLPLVQRLLTIPGIDLNALSKSGSSALLSACRNGHLGIVQALLASHGTDLNIKNSKGDTPLLRAASGGHIEIVKLLLDAPDIRLNEVNADGWTALGSACSRGHRAIVEILLRLPDIDVNKTAHNGWPPLVAAVHRGHEAIAKMLLQSRTINVNATNGYGASALLCATSKSHVRLIELLLAAAGIDV